MKLFLRPFLLVFMLSIWICGANQVEQDAAPVVRGISQPDPSLATSVLCHVMEMQVEYQSTETANATTTPTNAVSFDHDFLCETMPPSSESIAQSAATWIYRISTLPDRIHRKITQDQERRDETWVLFSNVLRNDAAATLDALPNITIAFLAPPSDITSATAVTTNNTAEQQRRHLTTSGYQNMGVKNVLVVRVSWHDIVPDVTRDELAGRIFGMGSRAQRGYNLRRQLKLCSFGKLQLQPAPPIHPKLRSSKAQGILQGVTDMHLTIDIPPVLFVDSVKILENHAMQTLVQWYGPDYLANQVNHIIIVLPSHPDVQFKGGNFLAYAYLKTKLSVYSNYWGSSVSALAHELGHNFGLAHAGEEELPYGDTSGTMGYGSGYTATTQFCFNAQKNWFLRWYEDRAMTLAMPSVSQSSAFDGVLPWTGNLAAFIDYKATSVDQPVLLKIQSDNQEKRLYLQYNRAKGFNEGTREYSDRLVVVEDSGSLENRNGVQSWLVGAIIPPSAGAIAEPQEHLWNITDFTFQTLNIQICQQVQGHFVDYLRISVFPEGHASGCPSTRPLHLSDCEDSPPSTPFWIRKNYPNQRQRDCLWLVRRTSEERQELCAYNSDIQSAYHVCAETCGKCGDDCEDQNDVMFRINALRGQQDCKWLSRSHPVWKAKLCQPGLDAWEYCRETCNNCESG